MLVLANAFHLLAHLIVVGGVLAGIGAGIGAGLALIVTQGEEEPVHAAQAGAVLGAIAGLALGFYLATD